MEIKSVYTKNWYALYTRSRNEKKVYLLLIEKGIDTFLPLYKTLRQWSDRKKWVEIPLFSSYVFVNIPARDKVKVLDTYGVVKFVTFEGKPVIIPQKQIDNLFLLINKNAQIEKTPQHFEPGQKVLVTIGSLQGLTGELVRIGKKNRVLVRFEQINQNLLVNIPVNFLACDN